MIWLLYVILGFLVLFIALFAALVYYYLSCIKFSAAVRPNDHCKSWKNEVLINESEEGRSCKSSLIKEENESTFNAETEHILIRSQRDSEEYWASDESGGGGKGRKSPVKKPRGKKGSQARFGVTSGSDSSASDNQSLEMPSSFPQDSEQKLSFLNSGTERDSDESALHGKPVNYSGNGTDRSSNSESFAPVEDYTPHDPYNMPHNFSPQNSVENHCIRQLREEINALKKELTSKDKRSANILNELYRLLGEKDREISELKKKVKILKKSLNQEKDRSEQVGLLRLQLQSAIKQSEFDQDNVPAEVSTGSEDNGDIHVDLRPKNITHRSLSQV